MNDAVTWAAMATAIGAVISIVTFWTRYSDRLTKAEGRATAAEKAATDAKETAKEAKQDVAIQAAAFGLYREKVAAEYVQREVMGELEGRLVAAIDRLGDRIDRTIDQRVHKA
jgi:hypothetical protein